MQDFATSYILRGYVIYGPWDELRPFEEPLEKSLYITRTKPNWLTLGFFRPIIW